MRLMSLMAVLLFSMCSVHKQQIEKYELWYDEPATDWMTEGLPFGNAYIGAMFFGGTFEEQIQFTEESLWAGGPGSDPKYNFGTRKGVYKSLDKIRELLKEGKHDEANKLAKKEIAGEIHRDVSKGKFGDYGAQQTMGDLFIKVDTKGEVKNYQRNLDISNAIGNVGFEIGKTKFERSYFASYPDKALVYRFKSSKPVTYELRLEIPHVKEQESYQNGVYSFKGKVADNGMQFETRLLIDAKGGKVKLIDGKIIVETTKDLIVKQVAATDYVNKYPVYKGNDFVAANNTVENKIKNQSFDQLKATHIADYKTLFDRVDFSLGNKNKKRQTTDVCLEEYGEGKSDNYLTELYFQYCRYLMISSTRPGSLPMHLQGKWNNSTSPPWAADYHTNINLQMLYWPAEITNLSECHLPLFTYMESLVEPGKVSAKEFFNTRGWIVNTMNNPFGYTAPGWGFPWGFFPAGASWLCQHVWEHYDFTKDETYLKDIAYPLLKESALFWVDYLSEDEKGYLVSSPSYSAEHGGISGGASMDHQVAWEILNNCVLACDILNIDQEFKEQAKTIRDKICPPMIGRWGQLQEWKEDIDDPKDRHRHLSHLYAVHPGKQIDLINTPELAEAAKVSLNARGDGGVGWTLGWKINLWARFKDGNRAESFLQKLLTPVAKDAVIIGGQEGGGSYKNLLCACPPFQLDGNMGTCAGIAEMLVQSHAKTIEFLPALPDKWEEGHMNGIKARGGFEVNVSWEKGELLHAEIKGVKGSTGTYFYKGKTTAFKIPATGVYKVVM